MDFTPGASVSHLADNPFLRTREDLKGCVRKTTREDARLHNALPLGLRIERGYHKMLTNVPRGVNAVPS